MQFEKRLVYERHEDRVFLAQGIPIAIAEGESSV